MPFRKPYRKPRYPRRRKRWTRYSRKRRYPFSKISRRLSGVSKMPYFRYARAQDLPVLALSTSNHVAPGLWVETVTMKFNDIPNKAKFQDMYRFFRIKKAIMEYTPVTRSDEYSKLFVFPTGTSDFYISLGGALEIKHLNYSGYIAPPTTWEQALNRAGKLKKCATTKAFRKTIFPKIHNIIEDFAVTDPMKAVYSGSQWLSTDNASNLDIVHYLGIDVFHSMNNISYDNAQPLRIQQRVVYSVEFRGLKV